MNPKKWNYINLNGNYKNLNVQKKPIKIACILAYYEGSKFIIEQIQSILNQDNNNFELHLFISDDCSEKEFLNLENYNLTNSNNFKIFYRKNSKNYGYALNFLYALNSVQEDFDYYCFSDQDDIWNRNKIINAVKKIQVLPNEDPILYCGRSTYYDKHCKNKLGNSISFQRKPTFKNAIIQNIAGGNTMVMNKVGRNLVTSSIYKNFNIVSHDWWCYQLISGSGGHIIYDQSSYIKYRQHKKNFIGANTSFTKRVFRIRDLLIGKMKVWNNINLNALVKNKKFLTKENRDTLDIFIKFRKESFCKRVITFNSSGIYRQTFLGNIALIYAYIFKKI